MKMFLYAETMRIQNVYTKIKLTAAICNFQYLSVFIVFS